MKAKSKATGEPLQPRDLGELYPTPKTYDEIQQDTEDRQALLKTYRTRMPAFKIAFFGSILAAAVAIYAATFQVLWLVGDMAAVFFSFAVWIILLLFAVKWLRYTINIFYEYASPVLAFWIVYVVVMTGALLTWRYGPFLSNGDRLWLAILPGVQFICTYITAKILITRTK